MARVVVVAAVVVKVNDTGHRRGTVASAVCAGVDKVRVIRIANGPFISNARLKVTRLVSGWANVHRHTGEPISSANRYKRHVFVTIVSLISSEIAAVGTWESFEFPHPSHIGNVFSR